jgi:hypothetical protein
VKRKQPGISFKEEIKLDVLAVAYILVYKNLTVGRESMFPGMEPSNVFTVQG